MTDVVVDDGAAPRRTGPALGVPLVVAAVLVVALVVLTALLSAHDSDRRAKQAAAYLAGSNARAAQAAAVKEVTATLTYSYKTLDQDFAAAQRGLTPSFRASYQHTADTNVRPLATKTHAVSSASVAAGGVSAASQDRATVLLFVDQTVQNNLLAHPRLDRSRVKVSMLKVGGRWLVDHLLPL